MSTFRIITICQVLVMWSQSCHAVIYHLNDTEYQRMPPLFSLEDYDSCLVDDGDKYCLVQLELYAEPENQLMRMIKEYSDHKIKHYDHTFINKGVCVRKTCQNYIDRSEATQDLTIFLEACLNDSLRREYGLNARLFIMYCDQRNEPKNIDAWDWTVFVIIVGLVIMNIVGSVYDIYVIKHSDNENMFLLNFSVIRNWNYLTNITIKDPKLRDLQFLHGIRVICNFSVIMSHVILIYSGGFIVNSHDFEKTFEISPYLLLYSGVMVVQIFFFTSGLLAVYKLSFNEDAGGFKTWDISKFILLRFSRFVPSLSVTLALATTWVRHAGSGPLWKLFVTDSLVADCRKYWWQHLLFVNNYMSDNKYCLIPTWHLAAEIQVYLLGLLTFILTRGRARNLVMGTLLLLSATAPALHTVLQDLDATSITPEFYRTLVGATYRFQHILGHNNLPCFIMGMIIATKLYVWQKEGSHLIRSRWYSLVQYLFVITIVLILYSGSAFYNNGPRASVLARAVYSSTIRLLVGITCAIAVPAFSTRNYTLVKRLFEWRGWVVPSRVSFSVYLLHMLLVHVNMGSKTQLSFLSGVNLMTTFVCTVLASYLVSIPFYLLVEAPFTALCNNIAKKRYLQIFQSKTKKCE